MFIIILDLDNYALANKEKVKKVRTIEGIKYETLGLSRI